MQIDSLMKSDGPEIYYLDDFRNVLEDHMSYLRTHPATTTIQVEPMVAFKFEYDFYGLLQALNVSPHLHWVVLRMNLLTGSTDYRRDMLYLWLPDFTVVEHIRQSHMSTRKIT